MVISTDVANEADDAFAIAYALLSPSLDVRCVVPTHFGHRDTADSLGASSAELSRLLVAMNLEGSVNVQNGSPHALPDYETPVVSDGARAIVREAMLEDRLPLFVLVLGPLTDVASALLIEPAIAERDITVIWIGGPSNPPDPEPLYWPEFNLSNDLLAANVVFESPIELWQIPIARLCVVRGIERRAARSSGTPRSVGGVPRRPVLPVGRTSRVGLGAEASVRLCSRCARHP